MYEGDARLVLEANDGAATATPSLAREAKHSPTLLGFFKMGVEHILSGYDHLLFLLGLVVVGASWRSLAKTVSAFTVAHSITLTVAALGLWTPPARVVEPMIALSIAYVGIENVLARIPSRRWRLTFLFGLIHGFGFASSLREVAPSGGGAALALLGFNLGVEAGQLAVIGLVLPAILLLRHVRWLEGARARVPSLGIAAVGAVWFVARTS